MPSIREHLDSPQFPDDEPATAEDLRKPGFSIAKLSGGWVGAGVPRKKAYAIYVASGITGVALAIPGPGDPGFFGIIGVGLIAFGVFGVVETLRGKRFPRP